MSFPKYRGYKHSGVEWLGDVPTHWETNRIRRLFEIKKRIVGTLGYDVLSITQQGLKVKDIESNDGQLSMDYSKYQLVEPGDFAMNQMDLLTGYVDIARTPGVTSPDYRVFSIRHASQCFDRYYLYLLQNCYRSKIFYAFGQGASQFGRWRLPTDQFKEFLFPQPPVQEQLQIGAFLDHETAKIDMLAEEQQRLIELLKEKRQALISDAVTKGLGPNVPMKDSSIEWLGRVPEHWQVRKISSISTKITNGYVGPTRDIFVEDGVRYLQSLHIKDNQICFDTPYYVRDDWSKQHAKSILETGDVLIVQTGDIGQVAVVTEEYAGCNCHALIIVSPVRSIVSGDWIAWVLNGDYGYHSLLSIQTGALHPHLNCGNVKDIFLPVPPITEQLDIIRFISFRLGEFSGLIAAAERAIALLRERRSALISAAVTGKIDVRGLVPVEAEAA